ncbi:MAG: homoserine dehydrogenase, partial [Pseudolabrys sp.]|nr:homoserine dehydrogenase [Pseudolabrys sp.]
MVTPLKIGIAGLGTVGSAVIAQIAAQRDTLAVRCGRRIEVVAVTARSRTKKRGVAVGKFKWHSDPLSLARDPNID